MQQNVQSGRMLGEPSGGFRSHFVYPILALTALIVVALLAAFGAFSISSATTALTQQIERHINQVGTGAASGVNLWLEGQLRLMQNLAENVGAQGVEAAPALIAQKTLQAEFSLVSFAERSGAYTSVPKVEMPSGYDARARPWYKDALATDGTVLAKPSISPSTGVLVMLVSAPVRVGSDLVGAVGANLSLGAVSAFLKSLKLDMKGFVFLVDSDGIVLVHPDPEKVMKPLGGAFRVDQAGVQQGEHEIVSFVQIPVTKWYVGVSIDRDDAFASLRSYQTWVVVLTAAILALILALLGVLLVRLVAGPVRRITASMAQLANGDVSVAIPFGSRSDEIGEMARTLEVFRENLIQNDRLNREQTEMKARSEAEKQAAMNQMANEFERNVKGIVQTVSSAATELQATAQSMAGTADETSRRSGAASAASEQASGNVNTVAAAAEQLSASIAEIGRRVAESSMITTQAVAETERTNSQIQALAEAAQRIGDVVRLINDIASQTNLLALNATIEAARAGDAGKGFAVVASEVKSLANQTARATEEIGAKVGEMQSATSQSVDAVINIGRTIGKVNEIATLIAAAMEEQGAATQEIARNVQQAAASTSEVSSNIGGVSAAAKETGVASGDLLQAAGELSQQSETLLAQVDGFIAKIRSA